MTDDYRPWNDLRESGLLWLINRVVLHPRGYALAIHYEGDADDLGAALGWSLMGDGTEVWGYHSSVPEDEVFAKIKALLP